MHNMKFTVANKKMINLIMHPLHRDNNKIPRDKGDMTNLFKLELLQIFEYAKKMVFDFMETAGKFRISLYSLLSIIRQSSLDEITLRFRIGYAITTELKELYSEANYDISATEKVCKILKKS